MKVWPRAKSLTLLLLVSLALNASIHLYLRLPFILTIGDINTSLGHDMLLSLVLEILGITLASAMFPALLLLLNFRLTAYGTLVICIVFFLQTQQSVPLGQLLIPFWILMVIIWLAWNRLRDLYYYYRAK